LSLIERINECNNHDLAGFRPFFAGAVRIGWVRPEFAARLAGFPGTFMVTDQAVALAPALGGYAACSAAIDAALRVLAGEGVIAGWRDEAYPVTGAAGARALFEMERAAIPHFGIRAYGVHVNGLVRKEGGLHLWIARRARVKQTYPGMLDNMIAGGQPVGISPHENVVKEAWEEAAVPGALASRARPTGAISYCQETAHGLKPDVMFIYDLELPADFMPENTDGEVAEFHLWPVEKVMEVVETSAEFKFNCNLVILDFCIRHGLIGPDRPDYLALVHGLRG